MEIETICYLDEQGILSPTCPCQLEEGLLIKGYKAMLLTRLVDEKMITIQRQGMISFALSSRGEEACAVASAAALSIDDWIYPQYRESGVMFFRGFAIQQYIHHMFGDAHDLILGRQMPNHFGSRALNVVTVSSPIGTQIPQAAGCAYAMKLKKEKACSLCFFGEGATSEGDFHVGLNFAAVRKAPVIFFCRNNGYAISTPACRQFASKGIAPKGEGYGMKAIRVDGNDFFAVYAAVSEAKDLCLQGKGPILIEAITYRLSAHSTSDDPSVYRNADESIEWEKRCPILRLKRFLISKGWWSEEMESEFAAKVEAEIEAAIAAAKGDEAPPLSSLIENVYFEVPRSLQRQYDQMVQKIS